MLSYYRISPLQHLLDGCTIKCYDPTTARQRNASSHTQCTSCVCKHKVLVPCCASRNERRQPRTALSLHVFCATCYQVSVLECVGAVCGFVRVQRVRLFGLFVASPTERRFIRNLFGMERRCAKRSAATNNSLVPPPFTIPFVVDDSVVFCVYLCVGVVTRITMFSVVHVPGLDVCFATTASNDACYYNNRLPPVLLEWQHIVSACMCACAYSLG